MGRKTARDILVTRGNMYVPTYQRRYSWDQNNVDRFLDDILTVINSLDKPEGERYKHYMGTVYLQETSSNMWELIDGQQRITTLVLLLHAALTVEEDDTDVVKATKESNRGFLLTGHDRQSFKVELSYDDDNSFNDIRLTGATAGSDNVTTNYRRIQKWLKDEFYSKYDDVQVLIDAIGYINLIEVTLHADDNAQEIFDGINATGKPLQVGDQVKNYLLMGMPKEEQVELYRTKWRPIELDLGSANRFGSFLMLYICIIHQGQLPTHKPATQYERFIKHKQWAGLSNAEFISDFKYYYDLLKEFEAGTIGTPKTRGLVKRLYLLHKSDSQALGYLLQVFNAWVSGEVIDEELYQILYTIEGYNVRHLLANGNTGSNDFYYGLHKNVKKGLREGVTYVEELKRLLKNNSGKSMPTDAVIRGAVATNKQAININTKFLLERVANGGTKEPVEVYDNGNYTIEHIMPRTLTPEWKESLGRVDTEQADIYLHTIGNLTLTGYNSEMSNKTFNTKLNAVNGLKSSVLRRLNESIIGQRRWGIKVIKERSLALAEILIAMYPYD